MVLYSDQLLTFPIWFCCVYFDLRLFYNVLAVSLCEAKISLVYMNIVSQRNCSDSVRY